MMWGRSAGGALGAAALLLGLSGLPLHAPAQSAATDPLANVQTATEALTDGNNEQAEILSTQAMLDPAIAPLDRARAYIVRATARERLGRREDALVDFTNALWMKVLPREAMARALYNRGVTLDELGRVHDAIGDYSGAILLVPNFAAAFNNRANAFRRLSEFADAKHDYKSALTYGDRDQEYPYYGLGQIAEAQGAVKFAHRFYDRALAANPRFDLAAQSLAALDKGAAEPKLAEAAAPSTAAPSPAPARQRAPRSSPRIARASYEVATPPPAPPPPAAAQPELALRASITEGGQATPASSVSGGRQIQLGAWRAEADAAGGWNHISGASGGLLKNARPHIVAVDLPGKGRYYRLRVEPTDGASVAELCGALKSRGFACMPVRA